MKQLLIMVAAVLAWMPFPAHAEDALIEGAKLCTRHFPRYEREYAVPAQLLSAISITETGRYHDGLKIKVPWPWTINADGKGYVYDSKAAAVAAARRFQAHGIKSIDVGCMQVNLYHHPHAFSSLDQAFDPKANIAYAASFLSSLYQQDGSWRKAAADYHSKTPKLGREYVSEVYNSWYKIISKLRAARMTMVDNQLAANEVHVAPRAIPAGARRPYTPPLMHMDSITLAHYEPAAGSPMTIHSNTPPMIPTVNVAAQSADNAPLAVAVAPAPAETLPVNAPADPRKTGPTFIFSD